MFDPTTEAGLALHRRRRNEREEDEDEPIWKCEFCRRSFRSATAAEKHIERELRLIEGITDLKEADARKKAVAESYLAKLKGR